MANVKLSLVDELFETRPLPDDATTDQKRRREVERVLIANWAPSLIKRGRELERREFVALGADVLRTQITKAQQDALVDLKSEWGNTAEHKAAASFWRGAMLGGLLLGGIAGVGTYTAFQSGMFGLVAANRSANDVWRPPAGEALSTHEPTSEAGTDRNPVTGRRLLEPADAP